MAMPTLRFRCLRPDHTDVYDEHVLASDCQFMHDAFCRDITRYESAMRLLNDELVEARARIEALEKV